MRCDTCGYSIIRKEQNKKNYTKETYVCFNCLGAKSPKVDSNYKAPVDPGEQWFQDRGEGQEASYDVYNM